MAIVTPEIWSAWANHPLTNPSDEYTSIEMICQQVSQAIKDRLKRTLEQATFTNLIFAAPDTPNILLQRYAPITIAGFDCRLNTNAAGNPAEFGTDSVLTMYTDYALDTDDDDPVLSPGNLQRIGTMWGIAYKYRPYLMTPQFVPVPGAVRLTFQGGYEEIPYPIVEAACLAVSMFKGLREHGFIKGSESWNGYSMNLPGVGLMMHGVIGNPDILGLLIPYMNYAATIG